MARASAGPRAARAAHVIADTTALRQVLYNRLSNAAKYAGADGPVTLLAVAGEAGVEVVVQDMGPGPGEEPQALFPLFDRSPHTATRASGTGIGVYVVSELLKAMGTAVEASARDPRGAAFRLVLPCASEGDAG